MADGTTELRPRQRNRTPARTQFPLPPPLQKMFDRGQANLAEPFTGITTDGAAVPNLYRLEKTGLSLQPVVDAAAAYLAALTPAQRDRTSFPLDGSAWRAWNNIHAFLMRHGLGMFDLDQGQREGALALVRASLSASGYRTARDVMKLNEHIMELTNRPDEYGEWNYWVSIMGSPSTSEPWGWQIDGHHLIINCFVLGDQIVLTPNFMGSEPVYAASGKYAGTRVFAEEEARGFAVMAALTDAQRAQATIGLKLPFDVMATAFSDNLVMPYQGVAYRDMTSEQRAQVEHLIGLYIGRIRPGHAELRWNEVKRHLDASHFAWIGQFDDLSPFYYRVHNPVVLIEFDHQPGIALDNDEPTRRHVHTLVRTPNGNDYGKDLLRQHYAQFDHGNPGSPHRQGKV